MTRLVNQYDTAVDVITWHSWEFAEVLETELSHLHVPVNHVTDVRYDFISPLYATIPGISIVYDPDPAHRHGYGFKGREFDLGRI